MSKKNKIIGFCGYAGVGKDTAYLFANKALPTIPCGRAAFADNLKSDLEPCIDVLTRHVPKFEKGSAACKELFRPMLVEWGRTARAFYPDIWILRAFPAIYELRKRGWVFITDIRYANEVKCLKREMKATIFYIDRPGFGPRNQEEEDSFKEIFTNYPEFTPGGERRICNDGTLDDFADTVKKTLMETFDLDIPENDCQICTDTVYQELRECGICGRHSCFSCLNIDLMEREYYCKDCKSEK